MIDRDRVSEALQTILQSDEHFPLLMRNASRVGFRFGEEVFLLEMDAEQGRVGLEHHASAQGLDPELWVEIAPEALFARAFEGRQATGFRIQTGPRGQVLHPSMERLIARIIEGGDAARHPLSDREDLIYPALFGFGEPQPVWQQAGGGVQVLRFAGAYEGRDAWVSSGLSDPARGPSPLEIEGFRPAVAGYELVLFAAPEDAVLGQQLAGWVDYVCQTRSHILQGSWLEYAEGRIPQTSLSGFLVVPPITIPDRFPLQDGIVHWSLLLGATGQEIEVAKESSVIDIAQALFDAGWIDFSAAHRESVVPGSMHR